MLPRLFEAAFDGVAENEIIENLIMKYGKFFKEIKKVAKKHEIIEGALY